MTKASDSIGLGGVDALLHDADGRALDAVFGEGATSAAPEREARVRGLLSLLEPAALTHDATLVDATMARVLRARRAGRRDPELAPADAAALDALVGNGWNAETLAGATGERARRIQKALAGVGEARMSGASLVDSTLARVQAEIDRRSAAMSVAAESARSAARARFTLSDLVSLAAMLVFGLGVLWPMAASWRESARLAACEDNLAKSGSAFQMYARDHRGQMPIAAAGFSGGPWWQVGDPEHSHSANLFTLARTGYASLTELSCLGNPSALTHGDARTMRDWNSMDEISFSYQLPARSTMAWAQTGNGRVVVLTDKSPVIARARRGEKFDAEARSLNHRGRGQNILLSDGSVIFLSRPVLPNGDNIWLPESITDPASAILTGTERPAGDEDAFVAP